MGFGRFVKNTLRLGISMYFVAYVATGTYATYDFFANHRQWLKHNVRNELVVDTCTSTLDDAVKKITFVGEVHFYNEKETEFARGLISRNQLVFSEGVKLDKKDFVSTAYRTLLSASFMYNWMFSSMGDGRYIVNPTLEELAKEKKLPTLYLEERYDGGIGILSIKQKAMIFGYMLRSTTYAPLLYYSTKKNALEESKSNKPEVEDDEEMDKFVDDLFSTRLRDQHMSERVVECIKSSKESNILVVVGKNHLRSILNHVKSRHELSLVCQE